MNKQQIFVLIESRNPFQVFMFIACIFSGLSGLFIPNRFSSSFQSTLPHSIQLIWYTGLIVGGVVAFYGTLRNIFIERIGITILTGIILGFTIVIISHASRFLNASFFLTIAFLIACVIRIIQITRYIKKGPT